MYGWNLESDVPTEMSFMCRVGGSAIGHIREGQELWDRSLEQESINSYASAYLNLDKKEVCQSAYHTTA